MISAASSAVTVACGNGMDLAPTAGQRGSGSCRTRPLSLAARRSSKTQSSRPAVMGEAGDRRTTVLRQSPPSPPSSLACAHVLVSIDILPRPEDEAEHQRAFLGPSWHWRSICACSPLPAGIHGENWSSIGLRPALAAGGNCWPD